jgi:lysozyme
MVQMRISQNGISHLRRVEAFMSHLYNDGPSRNTGNCTVGYGHLVHYNPCNIQKFASEHQYINGISVKNATTLLRSDVRHAEAAINKLVTVPLNQNQFDALVSLVFNIGVGAFSKSTLLKVINAKQFSRAPSAFRMWNKTGGKISHGLINRRASEIRLFQKK